MESDQIKSFSGRLKALVEANKDLPQKLKQRLVSESGKVENPFKFIVELLNGGVLCDGSNDLDAHFGFKEMLFQLAVTIGCSKGSDGIGGLVKALESSENLQLLSDLKTWVNEDFGIESDEDGGPSEPEAGPSALQSPPRKKLRRNVANPTELSLPNPPRSAATGLFVATTKGLISLDLHTLEALVLTSEWTPAVAVNHNLKKVYWSEDGQSARIVRSNFDGNAKQIIVPSTVEATTMLAIDETSGNVYFVLSESHEIKVCNALGGNCAAILSSSSLVDLPLGFALDSANGFMYWSNFSVSGPRSLVRAKLDGSNAGVISTGFEDLCAITLEQPSNGVLYGIDGDENTIGTIDANGSNMQTLVELEGNAAPDSLQVDAQKIFFSNSDGRNIQSVNRDSGEELTTIFTCTGYVNGLALFSAPSKRSYTSL